MIWSSSNSNKVIVCILDANFLSSKLCYSTSKYVHKENVHWLFQSPCYDQSTFVANNEWSWMFSCYIITCHVSSEHIFVHWNKIHIHLSTGLFKKCTIQSYQESLHDASTTDIMYFNFNHLILCYNVIIYKIKNTRFCFSSAFDI